VPNDENVATGTFIVASTYQWIGDPRLGSFQLYVDGKHRGTVPPGGCIAVEVSSDTDHAIQVRLWHWFRSARIRLTIGTGEHLVLQADVDRTVPAIMRLARGMLQPWSALSIRTGAVVASATEYTTGIAEREPRRLRQKRLMVWDGVLSVGGFVLLIKGIEVAVMPLWTTGIVFILVGTMVGIRAVRS
jgi:hypothetical protein